MYMVGAVAGAVTWVVVQVVLRVVIRLTYYSRGEMEARNRARVETDNKQVRQTTSYRGA